MITSDTPETDAELYGIKAICKDEYMLDQMAEFARKLERERDEARDQLIHLRSCVYDVIHSLKSEAFDELEKAWKEGLK